MAYLVDSVENDRVNCCYSHVVEENLTAIDYEVVEYAANFLAILVLL